MLMLRYVGYWLFWLLTVVNWLHEDLCQPRRSRMLRRERKAASRYCGYCKVCGDRQHMIMLKVKGVLWCCRKYAPTIQVQDVAVREKGWQQVLWLHGDCQHMITLKVNPFPACMMSYDVHGEAFPTFQKDVMGLPWLFMHAHERPSSRKMNVSG